jgi:hypothetical protein
MRALCSLIALTFFSTLANAVPVQYSFELTVTEIRTGDRVDPYYANFHLGQKFTGTFFYDFESAVALEYGLGYWNTFRLEVMIDETLVTTRYDYKYLEPGYISGTRVSLTDGPEGGMDSFFMFEEVPHANGGYLGDYQAEQFYIDLYDFDGTALTGDVPGPIDFTQFDGGRWNFWSWGRESMYSSLLLYGTVSNIREVPEPSTLWLASLSLLGVVMMRRRRSHS